MQNFQMFTRCVWDEQPCSLDEFDITVTDYGYCYTFNHGRDQAVKQVSTTGIYISKPIQRLSSRYVLPFLYQ